MLRKFTLLIIKVCRKLAYNTPVHRLKIVNVIYEKLFHAAFKGGENILVPYEGSNFYVPSRDITILPSMLNNCYEKQEIKLLKHVLKPGMTFVDVGANISLFSVIAAKCVGKTGKVYSFEPEPENYALLKENLALNKINNTVTENLALGCEKAILNLEIEKNSIGTHSLLNRKDKTTERSIEVDVIKLDDYFKNITKSVDVIKIDVEGYEPFVLKGAEKILKNVQFLFFEYSRADIVNNYGIEKFLALLESFPYLYGINEKQNNLDLFEVSNFFKTKYLNIIATKIELGLW